MKDIIEQLEATAERQYYEMLQPEGMLKCCCGKLFHIDDGQMLSPNPYAMPVCSDCFKEAVDP